MEIKSKTITVDATEVLVEYWTKNTIPPSLEYRATCGQTVLQSSMTLHADKPRSKDEVVQDHNGWLQKLAAEAAITEAHRGHLEDL